jgi:hypothetical protein
MFGAEVSRLSGEPAPIPAYLTDKRLKIRISKLPEKVREMLHRKGYVGLMVGNTLTWTNYEMDKPFIRISLNPVLRGLMEKAEGGGRKIGVKILYNKYYWAIQYMKDLDMDGNILSILHRELSILHRERQGTTTRIYKDLKGTNTTKRNILCMPCGLIPGLFRLSSLPFGDSCDVFGSRLRFLISFRLKAYCHASTPLP